MNTPDTTTVPENQPQLNGGAPASPPAALIARRHFLALVPVMATGVQCPSFGSEEAAAKLEERIALGQQVEPDSPAAETEAQSEVTGNENRPWCVCVEVLSGLDLYYIWCEGGDEVPMAPVLTDNDGYLLYCTDTAKIPEMLALGRDNLARHGEPDLEDVKYVSVPDALEELRLGKELGKCWDLFDVFDALTDLLASSSHTYDDGIFNFMMGCFSHMMGSSHTSLDEVMESRSYRGLTVEEGIQLALGIVLTNGRHVA